MTSKGLMMNYTKEARWSDVASAFALLVLGIVLCFLGSGLLAQWQASAARNQEISVEVLVAAAAAAAGIGILLWWAFAVVCAGSGILLERLGRRRAAAAVRRFSPAFMQRAVVAALSIQLLTGVAAQAAGTNPGPAWGPTPSHSSSAPSTSAPTGSIPETGGEAEPAVEPLGSIPATAGQPRTQPPVATLSPGWRPDPQAVQPSLLTTPDSRAAGGASGTDAAAVTVLAGDTLWDIVASQLGPGASDVDIALEWPRWYSANRGQIGGNPDVLLPGQILQAP
ncbi:LysM peptidoglycan-binding domain-containing protein [Pseudarthrobacter sp. NPDC058196]|uniref:LysM peptidoglycan-binding domain-containing protein n=1 Tax=Pseudarthrobacter sp. NPDC058196 TaxID=3346376 RepID=UPI0036DF6CA7